MPEKQEPKKLSIAEIEAAMRAGKHVEIAPDGLVTVRDHKPPTIHELENVLEPTPVPEQETVVPVGLEKLWQKCQENPSGTLSLLWVGALIQRLARAEQDVEEERARLDWLAGSHPPISRVNEHWVINFDTEHLYRSLREAIDAARSKPLEKNEGP